MRFRVVLSLVFLAFAIGVRPTSISIAIPNFTHVFVIVMENHEYEDLIGNPSAPYINSLAQQYGLATAYFAVTHPSLPNYMALTSGDTFFADDCVECTAPGVNLIDRIEASGRTWTAYMEDMPGPCTTTDAGLYTARHNPFVHYADIVGTPERCSNGVVPFSKLSSDLAADALPSFVWITPNVCNDMHDCAIATGDAWLQTVVPSIAQSAAFANSVLFVVWDEGTTNDGGGGHVPLIVVSPMTPRGTRSADVATHYHLLRTIEDAWGLSPLGQSANATSLSAFFRPPVPDSPNPADGSVSVTVTPTMSWRAAGATSYDVRFGTSATPPPVSADQTQAWYVPPTLTPSTTYYWQIIAHNASGSMAGPVWTFTTGAPVSLPGMPANPSPLDAAVNVGTMVTLAWASSNATSYDVKFGTSSSPPLMSPAQAGASYAATMLAYNTTYYWQIVAHGANGVTAGPVWTFTTASPPPDSGAAGVLWRNSRDGVTGLWQMRGMTVAAAASIADISDASWEIKAVQDLNGDGRPDIVWRHRVSGQNAAWLMDGFTVMASGFLPTIADLNWELKGGGDFDGDGRGDLIWRNKATGANIMWLMNGLTIKVAALAPTIADANWDISAVADLDADRRADVLWRHRTSGQNLVWLMNGTTIALAAFLPAIADLNWKIKGLGDVNGDGTADIVWRNMAIGENVVWEMNGPTVMASAHLAQVADVNWDIVRIGDFGPDGKADLLWRNNTTGQNVVWRMDGFAIRSSAFLPSMDVSWRVAAR